MQSPVVIRFIWTYSHCGPRAVPVAARRLRAAAEVRFWRYYAAGAFCGIPQPPERLRATRRPKGAKRLGISSRRDVTHPQPVVDIFSGRRLDG